MKNSIYIILLASFGLVCCNNNDDNIDLGNCDFVAIISSELYKNAPKDQLTIDNIEINSDCLKIGISSSGCDGGSWELKLIDSGDVLESNPPQRNLKLLLKNTELCKAYIRKEFTFNIANLRVEGNQVRLNIINADNHILYKY